jgi:amidophosphoribosyltransferase
MCGIIGFLDKRPGRGQPLGRTLLTMLQALACRGPDSAGVALFEASDDWHLRLSAPAGSDPDCVIAVLRELGVDLHRHYGNNVYDALLRTDADVATLEARILHRLPGAEVICLGQRLNLFKQVGSPEQLEKTYHISELTGTHGIGHTRLSTESRVDLSH